MTPSGCLHAMAEQSCYARLADVIARPKATSERHIRNAAGSVHPVRRGWRGPQCLDSGEGFGIRIEGNSGRNIITNNIFVNIAQKMPMHAIQLAGRPPSPSHQVPV